MKAIFQRIYSIWAILGVAFCFFIFIIPLYFSTLHWRLHFFALHIHTLWGWGILRLALIPVSIEKRFKVKENQNYIFCSNHFSYLDVPVLSCFPLPIKFVGKSQLGNIPLFSWMYNQIHITVNRKSYKSRADSLLKAKTALKRGFSLAMFPEGGIRFSDYPQMARFHNGVFKLAVEMNVPIVPVTLPNNHFILCEDGKFLFRRRRCNVIFHPPEYPKGTSNEAVAEFSDRVFSVIQNELNKQSEAAQK